MTASGSSFKVLCASIIVIISPHISSCRNTTDFSKSIPVRDAYFKGTVMVERMDKLDKYSISIFDSLTGGSDRIYTPYAIFEMETGDVNHDGRTDICIGIIKPTPFDPVLKKRLFIFQIDRDYIRPLWLSSRLVRPLEEFAVVGSGEGFRIRTMEREKADLFCINEYEWESFGMTYIKTRNDSLDYTDAKALLLK
ncbi:MAG TPA: hypothetical protein VHE34_26100 [Puia sp.]|uniref:hypothetical protein n=1 Tax=Puia sp. TaxID=2045100 RepID=UPI002C924FD9|nr:hypothetical protein [Puia sp.]HVU98733.1 hypothetical protein [Puia sp.]